MDQHCQCSPSFDGDSPGFRRIMWLIIALNGGMFFVEWIGGYAADSRALKADALDFLGDALTYGLTLLVVGCSLRVRSAASLLKGLSLGLMAVWVIFSTGQGLLVGSSPESQTMGIVGFIALGVNLLSVALLLRYREGDANVRSVWLCSRNDAVGNVMVMIAAFGVWKSNGAWPDLIVAGAMAALFLSSSVQIVQQSLDDYRHSASHSINT